MPKRQPERFPGADDGHSDEGQEAVDPAGAKSTAEAAATDPSDMPDTIETLDTRAALD